MLLCVYCLANSLFVHVVVSSCCLEFATCVYLIVCLGACCNRRHYFLLCYVIVIVIVMLSFVLNVVGLSLFSCFYILYALTCCGSGLCAFIGCAILCVCKLSVCSSVCAWCSHIPTFCFVYVITRLCSRCWCVSPCCVLMLLFLFTLLCDYVFVMCSRFVVTSCAKRLSFSLLVVCICVVMRFVCDFVVLICAYVFALCSVLLLLEAVYVHVSVFVFIGAVVACMFLCVAILRFAYLGCAVFALSLFLVLYAFT